MHRLATPLARPARASALSSPPSPSSCRRASPATGRRADRRHTATSTVGARLLDRGLRRRGLHLRWPALRRVDGRRRLGRAHGGHRPHQACRGQRPGTGPWPPTAASSPSATPPFHGSMGGHHAQHAHGGHGGRPRHRGYWTVASDGGVFAFDDAASSARWARSSSTKPVVAMAATPDGRGYWLVASDGGVFAFGDAGFPGSLGKLTLQADRGLAPAATPAATGWWPPTAGSSPSATPASTAPSAATPWPARWSASPPPTRGATGSTDSNGRRHRLRRRRLLRLGPPAHHEPVVGMADGPGTGVAANGAYPSGSLRLRRLAVPGQPARRAPTRCRRGTPSASSRPRASPTGPPTRAWPTRRSGPAAGLNLYIFMTYGTDPTDQPGCNGDMACNWGYEAGLFAYQYAQAPGREPPT